MVKNKVSKFAGFLAAVVLASVNINSVEGADISNSTELTKSSNYRGTVNITDDITLGSSLSPVSIGNSNVTINGNNKTIDMNGNNSNLWTFNSSKIGETIKDLTFTNIGASENGLIYANVKSNVSVNNVRIVNSTIASATNIWGNIVSVCNNSTVNIDNLAVSNVSITAANSGKSDGVSGLVLYLQRGNGYDQSSASLKNSNIKNNTITTNNRAAYGGIIANEGKMTEISGATFEGNTVKNNSSSNGAYGGVIANGSSNSSSPTITSLSDSNFIENAIVSSGKVNSKGGAIYNTGTIGTITNSIFTGNYTQSNGGTAQGGAIYTNKDLTIKADAGTTEFSGNYVSTDSGTTKNNEAIYVDNSSATLTLSAIDNGTFIMNDYINGKDGYTLKLSADDNSNFYLNNLIMGTPKATLTNVTVDWQNNALDNVSFNTLSSTNSTYKIDVDLSNATSGSTYTPGEVADGITISNTSSSGSLVTLSDLNFINGSLQDILDKNLTIQVVNDNSYSWLTKNPVQLALSSALEAEMLKIVENSKTTTVEEKVISDEITKYATVSQDTSWSDKLENERTTVKDITETVTAKGKGIGLTTTNTTNDSIGVIENIDKSVTATREESVITKESAGDTLKLVNQDTTNKTKNFKTTSADDTYTVSEDLGSTKNTVNIIGVTSDTAKSTVDLNGKTGFVLDEDSKALNLQDVKLTDSSTTDKNLITATTSDATIGLNNAYVEGNIAGSGNAITVNGTGVTTLGGTITNANTELTGGTLAFNTNTFKDSQDKLTVTGGTVDMSNGTIEDYVINELNSSADAKYSIDVNLSGYNKTADRITLNSSDSTGTVTIDELNFIGSTTPSSAFELKIIDNSAKGSNVQLALTDKVTNIDYNIGTTSRDEKDTVLAKSTSSMVYQTYTRDGQLRGNILTSKSTGSDVYDSIKLAVDESKTVWDTDRTTTGVLGDTLALWNQLETTEEKIFTVNSTNPTYTVTDNLGTVAGKETVTGKGVTGATIDFNKYTSFNLDGTSASLTLEDVILKNATRTGNGGAISLNNSHLQTNSGTTFSNNTATGNGGAIYLSGFVDGEANTLYGTYESNNATNGGAIYVASMEEVANINGTFTSNHAQSGGAIYNNSHLGTVVGTFTSNTASNGAEDAFGGAISNNIDSTIDEITNSTFTSNTAHSAGGAIDNKGTITTISNTTFDGNGLSTNGGAIYNTGTISSIINSEFKNNNTGLNGNGGAIYNTGNLGTVTNTSFTNNSARDKAGAIYTNTKLDIVADGSIANSTGKVEFKNNSITSETGTIVDNNAIYVDSSNATLTLNAIKNGVITFDDNIKGSTGYNVAVTGDSTGTLNMHNTISGANLSVNGIGNVNLVDDVARTYDLTSLTSDSAVKWAIDVDAQNLASDKFTSTAVGSGTVLIDTINWLSAPITSLTGSKIQILSGSNTNSLQIALSDELQNSTWDFGKEDAYNGTDSASATQKWDDDLYDWHVTEKIYTGHIQTATTNTTNDSIEITKTSTGGDRVNDTKLDTLAKWNQLAITDTKNFNFGTANDVYTSTADVGTSVGTTLNVNGVTADGKHSTINLAEHNGFVVDSASTALNINDVNIQNSSGYIIANNSGTVNISNSTLSNNNGVIYNKGTIADISNTVITNYTNTSNGRTVSSEGSAIFNEGKITNIANSSFTNNTSSNNGGAIYNEGIITNISGVTFDSNSATHDGAAIYNASNGNVTISNSSFVNNTGDSYIYNAGTMKIQDTNLSNQITTESVKNIGNLTLKATSGKTITANDIITSDAATTYGNLTLDGNIELNNNVINQNINALVGSTVKLTDSDILGGTLTNNGSINVLVNTGNNNSITSSEISGSGSFEKTGAGTLNLSSVNNSKFTGTFTVSNGTVNYQTQSGGSFFPKNATLIIDNNTAGAISSDARFAYNATLTEENLGLGTDYAKVQLGTGTLDFNANSSSVYNIANDWITDKGGSGVLNLNNGRYSLAVDSNSNVALSNLTNDTINISSAIWDLNTSNTGNKTYNFGNSNYNLTNSTTMDWSNKIAGDTYNFGGNLSADGSNFSIDIDLTLETDSSGNITTSPISDVIYANTKYGDSSSLVTLTKIGITDDNGKFIVNPDGTLTKGKIQVFTDKGNTLKVANVENSQILSWATNIYKYGINSASSGKTIEGTTETRTLDSIEVSPAGYSNNDTLRDLNRYNLNDSDANHNRGFSFIVVKDSSGNVLRDSNKYSIFRDLDTTAEGNFTLVGSYIDANTNSTKSILSGSLSSLEMDEDDWGTRLYQQDGKWYYKADAWDTTGIDVTDNITITGDSPSRHASIATGAFSSDINGSMFEIVNNTNFVASDVSFEDAQRVSTETIKDGSVIYANNENATVKLTNTDFKNNTAVNGGAIANINSSTFEITAKDGKTVVISGNRAADNGGAIYNASTNGMSIIGATVSENTSTIDGGAIYNASKLSINQSAFDKNIAGTETQDGRGGAIYTSANLTITDSNFGVTNKNYNYRNGNKVENDIWVDNTATVTFATGNNGNIINSGLAGSGNFTKTGDTTLTLAGNNSSLTGTTTIQNGILAYTQTDNSSFVGGNVVVGTDAQLNYTNSISDVGMDNVVSGSGKVNKFGTKTLTVTNALAFTGEFNVNEGTLSFVGSTINATVNNTSANTDATISVDGTTMNGVINNNNKLVLSGTNSLYQVTGNGNVTVNSGANVTITDSLTQSALTNSGTIANNGSIILNNLVNNTSATITGDSGRLTLNGTSTNSGSITQGNISNTGTLTNNGTLSATDKITNSGSITTNASNISAKNGIENNDDLTLTGGKLASTVSGTGKTTVNGTVTNSAVISQAVDVTTGGNLTVGANIGNLTNAGKVTANAGNLTGTIENNKDLTLIGGTLVNEVSGDGKTTVNGKVTNSAAVSQAVAVTTGGDLTVGANIGNLTNAGTVTAKADNLTGSINNVNILNLSGTLNKEISGTGKTNIATDLALGESAKIDGTLNMNSGNLTVQDGKTTTFEIGKIQGSGNVAIDVNYTTNASDVFKVGAGSDANIIISSINGLQQLQSTDIGKVFKILDKTTSSDSVQIAISDTIKNNYNKIYGIENYFDTPKDKYILNNDSFIGTVTIDVNDKKDSIVVVDTGTSNPLIVTNVTSTTKEREFTLTKDTIVESDLGATGQGIFTLKGNNKTLTLGDSENFDINNGVTFNLSDITLAGKDTVIANKDGILTVDNSAINGNISNEGNLTIKNASSANNVTGSGKTIINDSANVTISSLEQKELTNKGNLTTGNLNITSSTNNSGTITNNGANSTVKNLTNNGTINGTGNLEISGTSTNDGSITQNTIVNNGNGALTNDSTITASNKVENNSTLSNKGTISTPELVNSGTFTNSDNGSLAVNSINNSGDFTSDAEKITAKTTGNIVEITNSKNINLGKGNLEAKLTQTTADTTLNIFDKNNENTSLNLKDGSSVTNGTITVGNQQTGATVIDSILTVSGGTITTGSDYAKLVLNSDAKLDIKGGTVNLIDSSSNISNVVWNGTVELNGGSLVLANIIDATRRDAYNKQGTLIANSGNLTIDTGSVLLGAGDTIAKDVLLTLNATNLYIGKEGSETASVYIDGNDKINGSINLAHSGSLTVDEFSTSSSSVLNAESGTLDIKNSVNFNNSNDLIQDTVKTTIATDSILNINNGNVTLNGTSTDKISGFDDSDTWSGKVALSGGNLTLDSITKEVSSTTYAQTSGTLNLIDGTELTISDSSITGGTVNVEDATLIAQSGIGADSNAVTLNVNTSNSIFTNNNGTSNVVLSNNGTIDGTGNLAISGTSTNNGSITQGIISNTGKLTNDGTLSATHKITNSGSITTNASNISAKNGIENNDDLTLTGGKLASTVSGTGKTTVNGTVTNSAVISQAVDVTTGGNLTVGANIGNLTNVGKVTANADNLKGTIANNNDLTLIGGTLVNAVSGRGTTTIDGTVTSNSAIANAISIVNDKTLTIGADNVKGSVNTNDSGKLVLNADGTLSKTITGNGTTTIDSNVTVDDKIAIGSDVLINENKTLTANAGKFGSDITGTITNNGTIELTGNDDKLISELSGNVAIKSGSTVGATNNSLFIGTLTNNGTYNMTDDLNKNILGSGTTVLQNDSVSVTDQTVIAGTLDANGKTIAMSDGANYQTLNVGSLKGDANLSIDVDVTNIGGKAKYNDKINITDGTSNSGTLNLKSINVLESTPTYQTGTYKNFVDYVTGKKDAITYKLDNNTLGTYSYNKNEEVGQYGRTYLFTLGNAGSLNVEVIDNDVTLSEFVKASTDRAKVISTYSINSDYSQSGTIGTTDVRSDGSKEISINLNNGHDLISTAKEYDGVTIADGYKLNIKGSTNSDSSDKSAMSNFKTALINNAGGTLNVKNMVLSGNTTDISNYGTTNFTGTNTLNTISGSGNATNAGILNIAATGLGNTLDNSGTLNLGDGTLSSAVSGDGTTIVNGKVTNNAKINQAVNVKADGDLTVGANIGNLTNAGKVTANAGNLTGTIENNKDLTLSGALNKEIAGSGTTNVAGDNPLFLGENASIKGVLNLNNNSISTSDNIYHTYEIGSITGKGSAEIDVDWTNSKADTFNTTSGSGTIALTLNATSTAEILKTKTIQITNNGVGISLSESSGTKDVVFTGSDDLKANVSWDDTFGSWKRTDIYSEKTSAVSSTGTSILDSIQYEVELKTTGEKQYQTDNDTLALIVQNEVSGSTDKSFITDSATKEYAVKEDLGTLKDNLTIEGKKDGDSISTIDLGEHKGIKIVDNNSLTIKDVQINSKDSNGTIVDATNSNANTTIDNAKINGNISNEGNLTIKNASSANNITGSGKTTINTSANVTTSSVEQSELTNKGNLTTGNLNITSSTNNSGTITNNGANSTVKNLTNNGTINGTGNLAISETSTNSGSITQVNISNTGKLTNDGTLSATDKITNSGSITTDASKISATNGIENNNDLTLTGGTLASSVSGTGKTTVRGTVTNSVAVSQAVNVTTVGDLTVGANIGNLTNAGKVTANVDNLTGTIENNKDLTLIGGTLSKEITGAGTTSVQGNGITLDNGASIQGTLTLDNGILNIAATDTNNMFNKVEINSGTINLINGTINNIAANSFRINGNTNLLLDVDLAKSSMDRLPSSTQISDRAILNILGMNLLSDSKTQNTYIQFAEDGLKNNVSTTISSIGKGVNNPYQTTMFAPIFKYDVSYNNQTGQFLFARGGGGSSSDYNPSVLASSVNSQVGAYSAINETFNYAFRHADYSFMPLPKRIRTSMVNRYALTEGQSMPYTPEYSKEAGIWFQPYANFENVHLSNGPRVDVQSYGSLVGGDSGYKELKHGWGTVTTPYIGYNGSSQHYSGVSTYTNGGVLGVTQTFYRDNLFTALTVNAGAGVGEANTMYGKENFTSLMAGVASKTGYNFEFADGKFIVQPSWMMAYTFVNTFDYTNAAGVKIDSDPLHSIQLHPTIKFMGNIGNGWQPYASVGMVWNILNDTKVMANDVRLPEMSVKPYVEYGVGVQKIWKDKFTGFFQAMLRNGGRNGVALTFGFKWALGNNGKPIEKVENSAPKTVPTVVKSTELSNVNRVSKNIQQPQQKVNSTNSSTRTIIKQLSINKKSQLQNKTKKTTLTFFAEYE